MYVDTIVFIYLFSQMIVKISMINVYFKYLLILREKKDFQLNKHVECCVSSYLAIKKIFNLINMLNSEVFS